MSPSYLSDLHLRVQTQIRQRQLFTPQHRLLIAVSGGQDSLCLVKILADLAPRWGWELFVLHCDHRWTPDETRCAQFIHREGTPIATLYASTQQLYRKVGFGDARLSTRSRGRAASPGCR